MFTNKYKTTIILIGFKKYKTLNSPCNRVDRIVKIIAIIFNMKNNLEGLGTQNILNLRQSALKKVSAGITSLEEINRITRG